MALITDEIEVDQVYQIQFGSLSRLLVQKHLDGKNPIAAVQSGIGDEVLFSALFTAGHSFLNKKLTPTDAMRYLDNAPDEFDLYEANKKLLYIYAKSMKKSAREEMLAVLENFYGILEGKPEGSEGFSKPSGGEKALVAG